jgi:superfamily II DNA or RNA helicase
MAAVNGTQMNAEAPAMSYPFDRVSRSDLPLRPYQEAAARSVLDFYGNGGHSGAVSLPTGTGKTILFLALARGICEAGGRAMVIAHRGELIRQPLEKLDLVWPGHPPAGIIKAKTFEPGYPVVIASIQTLWRRLDRISQAFDFVVIDEAHHASAGTYRKSLDRLLELDPGMKVLGVSGTLFRTDDQALGEVFESVLCEYSTLEAISDGWLCSLDYRVLETSNDLDSVGFNYRAGDFKMGELSRAVNTPERNDLAVQIWLEQAGDRKTLAFTVDVQHALDLAEAFQGAGIQAEAITGKTPVQERRSLLRAFAAGEISVITNCLVLTEGFDDPSVDCLLLARPTASKVLYAQMVGRGLRIFPNKTDCLILDLVDANRRHSLVTLADLDPGLKRRSELEAALGRENGSGFKVDPALAQEIVNPTVRERIVFDPSQFHWAKGKNGWAVSLGDGQTLYVREEAGETFSPFLIGRREDGSPIRSLSTKAVSLEIAFGIANGILHDRGAEKLYQPDAGWRRYVPSEKQAALLDRMGYSVPATKGEAADLITLHFAEKVYCRRNRPRSVQAMLRKRYEGA